MLLFLEFPEQREQDRRRRNKTLLFAVENMKSKSIEEIFGKTKLLLKFFFISLLSRKRSGHYSATMFDLCTSIYIFSIPVYFHHLYELDQFSCIFLCIHAMRDLLTALLLPSSFRIYNLKIFLTIFAYLKLIKITIYPVFIVISICLYV